MMQMMQMMNAKKKTISFSLILAIILSSDHPKRTGLFGLVVRGPSSQGKHETTQPRAGMLLPVLKEPQVGTDLVIDMNSPRVGNIRFSSNLAPKMCLTLARDLYALPQLHLAEDNGALSRILKLEHLTPHGITAWLETRIKYIVDGKFQVYKSKDVDRSLYLADNYGLSLFEVDRKFPHLAASVAKIPGVGRITVKSPRVGIIRVFPNLFVEHLMRSQPLTEHLIRLSVLFHEGRHSDGNGANLGFPHISCPPHHDFEGAPACDSSLNGSYAVAAAFLLAAYRGCTHCSTRGLEHLKVVLADTRSRLIEGPTSKAEDETPEEIP